MNQTEINQLTAAGMLLRARLQDRTMDWDELEVLPGVDSKEAKRLSINSQKLVDEYSIMFMKLVRESESKSKKKV